MSRLRLFAALSLALAVAAASLPAAAQDTGSADFTRFVAVGDSLGAGYVSGGLVRGAQEDSVPALVARQATGAQISQPLVSPPGAPPLLQLVSLSPLVIRPRPGQGTPVQPPPYQNLSVPGFDVSDSLRTVTGNPIIDLVLQGRGTQLQQALGMNPTFALVWLGNNDVLGAAVSGRVIEGVTLTPVAQFEADYTAVVGALHAAGADLALATLPDVTAIPYVTTIPPFVANPTGGPPIPILGPGGVPIGADALVLLPTAAKLAQGIGLPPAAGGTGEFLKDEDFLSGAEVATIRARVQELNQIIGETARQTGAALAEVNALLQAAVRGINIGGVTFSTRFIFGGIFSLDGVHPAPLGYAVAANEFLRAINETYDADIPAVDLFPFIFGSEAAAIPGEASSEEIVFSRAAARQLQRSLRVWHRSGAAEGPGDGPGTGDAGAPAGPAKRPAGRRPPT